MKDFETFDNQFYPTPRSLALRMFHKFKDRNITRLLEPSAGRGDLADVAEDRYGRGYSERSADKSEVECVELDLANQAILREKGYRVVGTDFLRYKGAAVYSHILMNPPFADGPAHVLHAWEILFTGEIVAIVNAQAFRNPNTRERKQLVTLVEDHGSVEFLREAFMTEDTKRKTAVEIALVHLQKTSTEYASFIDGLRKEVENKHAPPPDSHTDVVLPKNFIDNLVINFECAVEAAKLASISQARANHYAHRFMKSITLEEDQGPPELFVATSFNKAYDDLKERAWSTVLRSTTVLEKLSSQAQKRIEADFKGLCSLEFTYENIWGFLDGLLSQQGQIQLDMVCDVFDYFTAWHTDNRVFYQGWKSNDKHRLNAFRIKTSRVVMPSVGGYQGTHSLGYENVQRFRDFDKVFAMLDGKRHEIVELPDGTKKDAVYGIEQMFRDRWDSLRHGERCSSDYFDVRYYPRAGTFHLYSNRKDLIERMNRIVGEQRKWLPHDKDAAPAGFWQQYEQAEKVQARMTDVEELQAIAAGRYSWNSKYPALGVDGAQEQLVIEHEKALASLGIEYNHSMLIEHERRAAVTQRHPALPAPATEDEAA